MSVVIEDFVIIEEPGPQPAADPPATAPAAAEPDPAQLLALLAQLQWCAQRLRAD